MKIAVYKDTFANNRGADIAVKNLAAGLSERGHGVMLFDKSQFAEKVRGDYDVIISTGTNEILDLAKVEGLPPVIQQFHTDPEYPFRHWIRRWRRNREIKKALRKANAFQVLCGTHVGRLSRLLGGVNNCKIRVIGNWSAFEASECALTQDEKVVICPGAINKDKNQVLLVDSFAKIASEFPGWQVHIYGKGKPEEEAALSRRIKSLKLEGRVLLKGYADLTAAYSQCAFVAFPSKTEGFGMAVLDAAMFAKPVLMIEDWIGCGEVVLPKDFTVGLKKLMSDVGYRNALGASSRAHCRTHYLRAKLLDEWENLLEAVVAE